MTRAEIWIEQGGAQNSLPKNQSQFTPPSNQRYNQSLEKTLQVEKEAWEAERPNGLAFSTNSKRHDLSPLHISALSKIGTHSLFSRIHSCCPPGVHVTHRRARGALVPACVCKLAHGCCCRCYHFPSAVCCISTPCVSCLVNCLQQDHPGASHWQENLQGVQGGEVPEAYPTRCYVWSGYSLYI